MPPQRTHFLAAAGHHRRRGRRDRREPVDDRAGQGHVDRDFDLLKWRSQGTNIKVRRLAVLQLLSDFGALQYDDVSPTRATYDHLLLTAHHRIPDEG